MKTPICLFLYNRPEHTRKALKQLHAAYGAAESQLFIFCDGPKEDASNQERAKVEEVREIADKTNGFKEVKIIKQFTNIGLANSIIMGVTQVIEEFGKVIVLEDDHLVHEDFLKYMNFYLDEYEKEERVMHVGGFARDSYLQFFLNRVYFTRFMDCWGWATWASRWKKLITDFEIIDIKLGDRIFFDKFNFSKLDYHTYFEPNRNGLRTWAIFWYFTIAYHNGLCIMPKYSYVNNIGNDGSGSNNIVKVSELSSNFVRRFEQFRPNNLKECSLGEFYIKDAYLKKSQKCWNTPKKITLSVLRFLRNWKPLFLFD
jgi:hypothetical protein